MRKLYVFLSSCLFVFSSWAIAEDTELLDTYLEDLPPTTSGQHLNSGVIVGQPVKVVVDENGQAHEVVQPQTVEYRRIETADGTELYKEVPVDTATPKAEAASPAEADSDTGSNVIMSTDVEALNNEDLEIIELEPVEEGYVSVEAPEGQVTVNNQPASRLAFCQQNPYAKECLLSKYLSLCKKDPQSLDCKSELQKFDNFCNTFPRAYKCKKAKIAAACKQNPKANECKTFTQRYCQKYPNAVFCKWN